MKQTALFLLLCFTANAQQKFTVYFDFDIAETNTTSGQNLSQWIVDNPDAQIQKIYGYTDKTGYAIYNQDLSERRASYVYGQLKAAGLDLDNIEEKGFGESQSTANYNAKDRKVVVYYTKVIPVVRPVVPVESDLGKKITDSDIGDKIKLKDMNFYNNMDVMLPTSRPVLEDLLVILKSRPTLKIQIQGHVCCQKEEPTKISEKRAIAVYNYLVRNGIDTTRLSYTSFGASNPIYPLPEKSEAEKIANRRVEIEIIAK